jgi:diguanylate cyclase (GGDEF)-like protein
MAARGHNLSPPSIRFLRWLIDPGLDVPEDVRGIMLSRMFSNSTTIIMGVLNSLLISGVALGMRCGVVFAGLMAADLLLGVIRVSIIRRINRELDSGGKPAINAYLITGIMWCGLQGGLALAAMLTGRPPLQILATLAVFAIHGPLCARNYPAPRYCMLLIALLEFPFVLGCVVFGNPWLLITLVETPPLLLSIREVIRTFQRLAIDTLKAELAAQALATHDPLTGLLNRRGFQEVIARHVGLDTPRLRVLALDLDGFKAVNDLRGHHVGDALLKAVAARISACVRPIDSVVRLGGDEFVVLLSNVTFAEASRLADRLIEDIGQTPFPIEGAPLVRVGVSIGIACAPEDGCEIDVLHRRADLALYEAKAEGRGRWRRFVHAMEETVPAA